MKIHATARLKATAGLFSEATRSKASFQDHLQQVTANMPDLSGLPPEMKEMKGFGDIIFAFKNLAEVAASFYKANGATDEEEVVAKYVKAAEQLNAELAAVKDKPEAWLRTKAS